MKAVLCAPPGIRLVEDWPTPLAVEGEVVLRVRMSGICDTDLHLARGYMGYRVVLGHEFVGQTEDGHRFTSEINAYCGTCETCVQGLRLHCPHRTVLGILGRDGAFAELVRVPERCLHAIPDGLADWQAVFVEPLAAAFRVLEQVAIGPETRALVIGDGKLGLLCAWVLALCSRDVHLLGRHPEKLALAGDRVGAWTAEGLALTPNPSFEVVVDATGSPSGLADALRFVRPKGTLVLKTTLAEAHQCDLSGLVIHEVTLIGSRCGPFDRAIDALNRSLVDVRPLIEGTFPFDEAEAAFRAAGRPGSRKILMRHL